MKHTFLVVLLVLVSACKVQVDESSKVHIEGNTTLTSKQIGVTTQNVSSVEVQKFKEEIESRQAENPDQIFEVVNTDIKTQGAVKLSALKDDVLYTNKNFYILIGLGATDKDNTIAKTDWDAVYSIMGYLSSLQYRVMINVRATTQHLRLASQDQDTSVVLWSSHGNKQGFYDYKGEKVPYDIFKDKSPNFHQLLLSTCEGRIALNNHYNIYGLRTYAWTGLTSSAELKSFIVSNKWSADSGKVLLNPKIGITCTESGNEFALMQSASRRELHGYNFTTLEACKQRLDSMKNGQICNKDEYGFRKITALNLKVEDVAYPSLESCQLSE